MDRNAVPARATARIVLGVVAIILPIAVALAVGCASTPAVEDGGVGAGQASQGSCEETYESCKTACRAEPDSGSRGPCFNGCLHRLQTCQGAE